MRPVIYDEAVPLSPPALLRHPYSLSEFVTSSQLRGELELQFKLERQQLDTFHQHFWLDVGLIRLSRRDDNYTRPGRATLGSKLQKKQC